MSNNNFILLNKNIPVLRFTFTENFSDGNLLIESIDDILNVDFAPLPLTARIGKIGLFDLNYWWLKRGFASFIRIKTNFSLDKQCTFAKHYEMLKLNGGRSLTDHYWVKPVGDERTYEEVNFFDNTFPNEFGRKLFTEEKKLLRDEYFLTPDQTLAGHSAKTWQINSAGERILCRLFEVLQPLYNELAVGKIFELFDIQHVSYWQNTLYGKSVSACKNFVDKDVEYISLYDMANAVKNFDNGYLQNLMGKEKYVTMERQAYKIALIAYVVGNGEVDLGILRNPDTLEIIGMAPVFDFANAFWWGEAWELKIHETILREVETNLPFYLSKAEIDSNLFAKILPIVRETFVGCEEISSEEKKFIYQNLENRISTIENAAKGKVLQNITKKWPFETIWKLHPNYPRF